jgi:hypothetical protein
MPFPLDGYDPMRDGLRNMKADSRLGHPVEQIQKSVCISSETCLLQTGGRLHDYTPLCRTLRRLSTADNHALLSLLCKIFVLFNGEYLVYDK